MNVPRRSVILLVSLLLALVIIQHHAVAQRGSIDQFFEDLTTEWVRADPDLAVRTRYFRGTEQDRLERQLTPRTREYALETIMRARAGLTRLADFDLDALDERQRVAAETLQWQLETVAQGEIFLDYDFPLQQFNGANVSLVNELTVAHPLVVPSDAANYVQRLAQVGARMNEATAEAERLEEARILPPRFIIEATLRQMEQFLAPAPSDNALVTTLAERTNAMAQLDGGRRGMLLSQAVEIVANQIYPAWRAAVEVLERQLPQAGDDAGLWRLERGEEAYAYQLRRFTTTELTADEIHDIGLREVARIEAEMDALLREVGLAEGTVGERVQQLEARLAYPDTDTGRAEIMSDIRAIMSDAELRAAELFDQRPEAPVIAQPYPEFRWESAAASYTAPPLDGSRPGIFQMPLRTDRLTRFALRSLVYHETVPGHHFQIALATENPDLPRFIQIRAFGGISAITEGWALYAEHLAAEAGWYGDDIEGRIGQLDSALFRARRLVVDTGLHAKGWTRQQAIDYGIPASEVDRYVVLPGQACAYMIGQLRIIELRERMREALGEEFAIQQFHSLVLDLGSVPLTVLERAVERRLAARTSQI